MISRQSILGILLAVAFLQSSALASPRCEKLLEDEKAAMAVSLFPKLVEEKFPKKNSEKEPDYWSSVFDHASPPIPVIRHPNFAMLGMIAESRERLIYQAIYSDPTVFTAKENELLKTILTNRIYSGTSMVPSDSKDHDWNFDLDKDSPHRLMKTSNKLKDSIYVNQDALLETDILNMDKICELTGLFVHEMGHQYGWEDTPDRPLDVLAAKIKSNLLKYALEKDFSETLAPHFKLFHLNTPIDGRENWTIFFDGLRIFNLTPKIRKAIAEKLGLGVHDFTSWKILSIEDDRPHFPDLDELVSAALRLELSVTLRNGQEKFIRSRMIVWASRKTQSLGIDPETFMMSLEMTKVSDKKPILAQPPKVTQINSANSEIIPGQKWNVSIKTDLPTSTVIKSAKGEFTSDSFVHMGMIHQTPILFDKVIPKKLEDGFWSFELQHTFSEKTKSRAFQFERLKIELEDGTILKVIPPQRTEVRLNSPSSGSRIVQVQQPYRKSLEDPVVINFHVLGVSRLRRAELYVQIYRDTAPTNPWSYWHVVDKAINMLKAPADLLKFQHDIPSGLFKVELHIPTHFDGQEIDSYQADRLYVLDEFLNEFLIEFKKHGTHSN